MSEHASAPILNGPQLEGMEDYRSVMEVFHAAVKRFADNPAFSCMGQTLSFADLDRLSADFAAWLQHETGLQPGDRIAIQLPNVLQFPVAVFGAMRAGLVVVNTNPLYTEREMAHQFKDSGLGPFSSWPTWPTSWRRYSIVPISSMCWSPSWATCTASPSGC